MGSDGFLQVLQAQRSCVEGLVVMHTFHRSKESIAGLELRTASCSASIPDDVSSLPLVSRPSPISLHDMCQELMGEFPCLRTRRGYLAA